MTEKDILNDLMNCAKGNCHECSRTDDEKLCGKIFEDAASVIKMQQKTIESCVATISRQEAEIKECGAVCKVGLKIEDLVSTTNRLIGEAVTHGEDYDNWGGLLCATKDFVQLVKEMGIEISVEKDYPQLKMK